MRKLKKKRVTNQAPKTSGQPVQIYTSPEEQFGLPAATPSVAPLINTGYTDYDLDPFYDNPRIRELRAANDAMLQQSHQDYNEYAWNKKIEEYYENFTKAKKTDKIAPLETLPIDNLTPELEQELKDQGFFINKTKTEAQLFPGDIIQRRVIDNGFRENQFSNYWGLDAKQVKQQYGDLFKAADKQYEATVLNKVLTEAIKQGKSPKEIFNNLPKSWGVTSELKKRYLNKSEEELQNIVNETNKQLAETAPDYDKSKGWDWLFEGTNNPDETFERTYYTKEDGTPDWEKINARSERREKAIKEFQKSNPDFDINSKPFDVIYKDDGSGLPDYEKMNEQALKYNMFQDAIQKASSEPFRKAQEEYTSPHAQEVALSIAQRKLAEAQAKNDYAGEAKILNALQNNKLNEIFSNEEFSNELSSTLNKRSKDYRWNRNSQNMSSFDNEPPSTGEKVWDVLTYPQIAFGYSTRGNLSDMWADNQLYGDKWELAQKTGDYSALDDRNIAGNFLNTMNPIRLGAESRKNYDAGRYGQLALDVGTSTLPFWGGSALRGIGQGLGKVLNYAPVKSMPWLNLQKAVIDPYFLYESVRPGGYFNEAYDDFSKGEVLSGIGNTAFGAMGVLPYVKPAKDIFGMYKAMNTPGGKVAIPTGGKYAFGYQSPQGSELFIGNPTMQNAVPAFESFTNPLNKFTGSANLGKFSIMRNQPVTQNFGFSSTGYNPRFLTAAGDIAQNTFRSGSPRTLDTEVPMYRVEPEGITYPTDKLDPEYMDWDYGSTSKMSEDFINRLLQQPNNFKYIDNRGQERIGQFFPQHTAGNWWSSVPIGTPGAPDYVTAKFAEFDKKPIIGLTTNVPFSQLNKYSVKNDPQALEWVGVPDKEFILPNEFKQKATINYRSGVPSSTGRTGITGDKSARKAFEQDLKTDSDYKKFIENSKIPEEQQTRRLNDSYDIPGRVLDSYGVPLATKDYKNFQTPLEINSNVKGSAGDIIEAEVLGEGNFTPTNDEIVTQLADDIRTRKIERWQSPEGQRRLQQMIDNTPSLQGLTPDDYIETMSKINVWNRQRNNATTELASAKEELQKLQEEHSYIYGDMYDSGQTPSKELVDELTLKEELIKTKIDNLDNTLSSLDAAFPHNIGYWEPGTQTVAIDPSKITAEDARLILGHELAGHVLGSPKQTGATFLDDALSKIDLIDDEEIVNRVMDAAPTTGQVSIMYNEPSGAYEAYGPGSGDDYIDKAIDYWETGSGGTEKVPFAAEVVEDMLAKGLIKSEYDKITPDLIKKHYNDYMNTRGSKYPLRLYDIMQGKNKNFKILSDVMNNLPTIAGAAIAADAILGDSENKEEDVTNAGLLMLFGRFGKPGKALNNLVGKLKSGVGTVGKGVVEAATALAKGGYYSLSTAEKKLLGDLVDLEKVRVNDILTGKNLELSQASRSTRSIHAPAKQWLDNVYWTKEGKKIGKEVHKKLLNDYKNGKLDQKTIDQYVQVGKTEGVFDFTKDQLDKFSEEEAFKRGLENSISNNILITISEEEGGRKLLEDLKDTAREIAGIEDKIDSYLSGFRGPTGERKWLEDHPLHELKKELNDLQYKRNKILHELGNYKLENNKISEPIQSASKWLEESVTPKASITDFATGEQIAVETGFPSTSMTYDLVKDLKDGDQVAKAMEVAPKKLDTNYVNTLTNNKNFTLEKLPGAKIFGSSSLVTDLGIPHVTGDIDVIMTDKDFAKVSGNLDVLGKASPISPATQVNIFPEAGSDGKIDVNIILTGPDGLAMDDPESRVGIASQLFRQFFPEEFAKEAAKALVEKRDIKIPYTPEQLMERYDPVEKTIMDAYEADPEGYNKGKHRNRPDVIVSYADEASLDKVASGQQRYIQSIVGPNGQVAKQFPEEAFNDPAKNLKLLNNIKYPGDRAIIAKSPKRMQLALNDWYIHETTYTRNVDYYPSRSFLDKLLNKSEINEKDLELIKSMFNDWDPAHGGGNVRGIGLNTQKLGPLGHSGNVRGHKQLNVVEAFNHPEYTVDMNDPSQYVDEVRYQNGNLFFTPAESDQLTKIYNETVGQVQGTKGPEDRWTIPSDIIDTTHGKNIYISSSNRREEELYMEFLDRVSNELGLRSITSQQEYNGGMYASTIGKIDESIDALMYAAKKDMYEKQILPTVKSWVQRTSKSEAAPLSFKPKLPVDTVKNFKKIKNILESGLDKVTKQITDTQNIINVINNKNQNIRTRFLNNNKKYQAIKSKYESEADALQALNAEHKTLMEQHDMLRQKLEGIQDYKKAFKAFGIIVGSVVAGWYGLKTAGNAYAEYEDNKQKKHIRDRRKAFRDRVITPAVEQGKMEYIYDWLDREGQKNWWKESNLSTPNDVRYNDAPGTPFQWDSLRQVYDLGPPIIKRKSGGETGIDLELTQQEIDELIKQGYKVVQR